MKENMKNKAKKEKITSDYWDYWWKSLKMKREEVQETNRKERRKIG